MDNTEKIAQTVFDKSLNDSQFGVGPVPYHTHNGTDSPLINSTTINVSGSTQLSGAVIFAAGTGLSVSQSGQTITYTNTNSSTVGIFGDGSDGDLTASSGTTTLSKDMYYNNVTLTGTAILNPNGYRIFVKGTLTIGTSGGTDTAMIQRVGNTGGAGGNSPNNNGGAAGTAATALLGVTVPDGNAGTIGVVGGTAPTNLADENGTTGTAGVAASAQNPSLGSNGNTSTAGGTGGNYAGFVGGVGGATASGGSVTRPSNTPDSLFDAVNLWNPKTFTVHKGSAAPGGGSSGGSGAHAINSTAGGGGGSGGTGSDGGFVCVYAKTIINYVVGGIQAKGGTG
jgi:hypothetical protein